MSRADGFRRPLAAAALVAAVLALLFATRQPPADVVAQDAETQALISDFNQYRSAHGNAPLAVSSLLNSDAQSWAQDGVTKCGYTYVYAAVPGGGARLGHTGYETASSLWQAYLDEPGGTYLSYVNSSSYHSVGVGRARKDNCNLSPLWVVDLGNSGGGGGGTPVPTPTHTPTPTPTATAAPTPTPTPTGAATPTDTPGGSDTPSPTATPTDTPGVSVTPSPNDTATPTPAATPTPTAEPTATPWPFKHGDIDCDGDVSSVDAMEVLLTIASLPANAGCLEPGGVDCNGIVDSLDALDILRYIVSLRSNLAPGCPPIGTMS